MWGSGGFCFDGYSAMVSIGMLRHHRRMRFDSSIPTSTCDRFAVSFVCGVAISCLSSIRLRFVELLRSIWVDGSYGPRLCPRCETRRRYSVDGGGGVYSGTIPRSVFGDFLKDVRQVYIIPMLLS